MEKWNITEYKGRADSLQFYYCRASIRNGYYIANGDERFYYFMGKNTCYSIPELLHPEDTDAFLEAVQRLKEEEQCLIVRIKDGENQYRCVYMLLRYNGRFFEDFASFDMELCDIMSIADRYIIYGNLVDKYREFMTMFPGSFFEYDVQTDEFRMYEYHNSRSRITCRFQLEQQAEGVRADRQLGDSRKAEFEVFYEALKRGRDHFKAQLDGAVLLKEADELRYEFRCSTLYQDDIKDKVVGIMSVISGEQPKQSYYLSENAYDPGTGLLNKRAIYEYALEKISNQTDGLYLAIMDVDDFKRINDSFGHMYGDEVLAKVSEIIRSVLRSRGIAGRFGGDEFMIVFEGIDSETTLRRILSTISKHVKWAFEGIEGVTVTTSTGIAKYPEDGSTYEELFHKADQCLYIAKAKGKNRFIIYDKEKHGAVLKEDMADQKIGLQVTMNDEEKYAAVSEIVLKLHLEGYAALPEIMERMRTCFGIDGVAVYAGEALERVLEAGAYVNPIQQLDFVKDSVYLEYVDEQGFYSESQISRLKNKLPEAYELYTKQESGKVIQCMTGEHGQPAAVVSFDFFNRSLKHGTMDMGLMKIAGRLMAQTAADEFKKKR